MGNVYLAVAQGPAGFTKMSVIKELKPSLLEEEGFLEMFLDEARLCARLNHPNVVQTNEVNVENGRAFLAMEYLDGQSLLRVRSRLGREAKLWLGAHVRVLAEACSGLHYAHELCDLDGMPLGVVHRDVSPHNVFVTYDGQVKLVDFGVAKAMSQSHETHVGVVKGKIPYMAPEHARSEPVDRRADIFVIGVLLWEAAAGKRMWTGHRSEGILRRLATNDIPPLLEAAPEVDMRLANIIARATAAFPEARYPTADLLRRDLEGWLATQSRGGHGALRELGEEMTRAFAKERAEVSAAVTQQIQLLREAAAEGRSWSVGLVRLNDAASSGSFPSGSQRSQSQPIVTGVDRDVALLPRISSSAPNVGSNPAGSGSHGSGSHGSAVIAMASSPRGPAPQTRSRRSIAVIAVASATLVVLAVLAAVVLGFAASRSKTAAASRPVEPTAPMASSEPPPSVEEDVTVNVRLAASPPGARVYLDGALLPSNPHVASFRKDAVMHQVRAEAPGHVMKTQLVAFDHEIDMLLALDRVAIAPAPGPMPRTKPGSSQSEPPVMDRSSEPAPPKPRKNQRPIDTDLEPR